MNQGSGARYLKTWFDACMGQCNNWTLIFFHLWITGPDSPMYMYDRVDDHIPVKGHTYLHCDRGFGEGQIASKCWKTIADKVHLHMHLPIHEHVGLAGYISQYQRTCKLTYVCCIQHSLVSVHSMHIDHA